ncbi:hypothetical protein XELAEV_18040737mg [Xenopus laevis]|uniref:Reverse transcriptase domain-containing protein n=1 Tax=Xenopus laevis TaxID=8355 RepID=A0A974CAB4_XENLA|nr:hypothetical protein XELAEV_18040737mg [Xenopus laevis]
MVLQPLVKKLDSFVLDTSHLLRETNKLTLDSECILVGFDVEALYMSIPHSLGLEAIKLAFERIHRPNPEQRSFILQALNFVLHHNVFLFDSIHYLQCQGVAIGVKCAPSYRWSHLLLNVYHAVTLLKWQHVRCVMKPHRV